MSQQQQQSMELAVENLRETNCNNEFHCEFKLFPVSFVNALRRILLGGIPTVVIRDVDILDNTTQLPHEMIRHRVEMMPVRVLPSDASLIRDAKIELRILPDETLEGVRKIYNTDFVVESGRDGILMNDRDYDTPMLFMRMRPNESLHLRARLGVQLENASQVCTASTSWHIDADRAKEDRKKWVEEGKEPAVFDNFYIQKSFSRNEQGRPDWIDLDVESIGVVPAKELVKMSVRVLREMVDAYVKDALANIERYKDGEYRIQLAQGGHTVCALLQEVMYYRAPDMNFVSYDIPHPLRPDTVLRFQTSDAPETVLGVAQKAVQEYCDVVEKGLA
jgi:DNA-directed RNA polymerase subunit L